MRQVIWGLALLLSACQVFSTSNPQAELQVEIADYVQDATQVSGTINANEGRIRATAEAASTQIAAVDRANTRLLATVRAGETPVPAVQAVSGLAQGGAELTPGQRYFVRTGVSMRVRDADGCVENPIVVFPEGVQRIYATIIAYNIQANTPMAAEWSYEGTVVVTQNYNVPRTADQICLWFYIDPTDAPLNTGQWAVQLYADGFRLETPMNFTIGETMSDGS
ncbi:MAG: hypothetical protein H6671_01740 [Anaerolineaceae bacterium]|nr:hypothetical protein [Anaerolineaceae bacterium]